MTEPTDKGVAVALVAVFISSACALLARRILYSKGLVHKERNEIVKNNPPPEVSPQEKALIDSVIPHLMMYQSQLRAARREGIVFDERPERLDVVAGKLGSAFGSVYNKLRDEVNNDEEPEFTSEQLRHRLAWEYKETTEDNAWRMCNAWRMWRVEREPGSDGELERLRSLSTTEFDRWFVHGPHGTLSIDKRMEEFYRRHPQLQGVASHT